MYRGKTILNNKWIYGSYMQQGNISFIIPKVNKNGYGKCIAVEPDTVSKFVIGMNNEAWFEGDILQHRNENWLGIIKFSKEKNKYMIVGLAKDKNFDIEDTVLFKRIGDKWSNPELFAKQNI